MVAFWVLNRQLQQFIDSQYTLDYDGQMTDKYFAEYTRFEVKKFRETLLQHMGNVKKSVAERTRHKRLYDKRVNKRQMQKPESKVDLGKALDVGLVVTESSKIELEVQDTSNKSGNDTDTDDADNRPIYDEEPMAEQRRKPILPSLRNQSVVRQPNAFKSERAQMSKQRFASQVDVNTNLSKRVTQHYLPKKTKSAFTKPDHMIASSSSRNNFKNMPRFSSIDRNSTTSVTTSARIQTTADDSKPKPRCNNQTSRSLPVSKSTRITITCVFNANHDACITKLPKEVNSRAKIQSHKTRNCYKPVDQKSHTQKPGRQIFTGHRFSPNKTSAVSEQKHLPGSDLSELPHGSNIDIPNIHECKQTLDVSAGTSINVQKEQSLDLRAESSSGPSDAITTLPQPFRVFLQKNTRSSCHGDYTRYLLTSDSEIVIIELWLLLRL
ncbi:hypothetical protein Tco_0554254 [Tanacetum coccineum]